MRYKIYYLLLSFGILFSGTSHAQDYYTVLIGNFIDVSPQDFTAARKLGFVYQQITPENIHQVYLGNYTDQAKATAIASALRNQGFANAQVSLSSLSTGGPQEIVIQIATRFSNRSINWTDMSKVGDLNVTVSDERIKIMTGTFPDMETAQRTLPNIRALGFTDAFVKNVDRSLLLPVTSLSTGVKEDLIPLQLQEEVATAPPSSMPPIQNKEDLQSRGDIGTAPNVPRPKVPGSESQPTIVTPPSSPTITPPSPPTTVVSTPNIRGNVKRNSVINLQRLLKNQGYYDSPLDGLYGNGTAAAYQQMLTQDRNIQKYRLLIPFFATAINPNDPIMTWEEIQLLQAICMDISNSDQPLTAENQRIQLYQSNKPVPIDQGTLLESWQQSRWVQLEKWAATDAYLLETAKSLSFAYFQSLVRLEDLYMNKGFDAVAARHLAIATIKTIVGTSLDRF